MTVAQAIHKITVLAKQTGLGVPFAGTGGQILRRESSVWKAERDTFTNKEIVSHQQDTGISYGLKKASGTISGVLSPSTYKSVFESVLRADFAAVAPLVAGIDVTVTVAAPQFVDASAGFLTAGLKVGDVVRWSGFTAANGNNNRNFLITTLTAGNMSGIFLDGGSAIAHASGDTSATVSVIGKKCKVPLTGHINNYYTIEEWYADITKSELFTDVQFNKFEISLPATGNATVSIDAIGLDRTLGAAQVLTTPTAETTTSVLSGVKGAVYLNGSIIDNATSAKITINSNRKAGDAVLGSNVSNDIVSGRVAVSGEFVAQFEDSVIQALYAAETPVSLVLVVTESDEPTAAFVAFSLGRIKLTGDTPDDGESKQLTRTYPFTAELNSAGGAALAFDETIISVQDSAV
jgi:hypothetical protein